MRCFVPYVQNSSDKQRGIFCRAVYQFSYRIINTNNYIIVFAEGKFIF